MSHIKKTALIIGTSVILLIGVGLYSLRFLDSSGERVLKTCLFDSPVKCGYVDFTEDEIVAEVRILDMSKKQAMKSFLQAELRNREYLDQYKNKDGALTEEDERLITVHEHSVSYYDRALHALEKMED